MIGRFAGQGQLASMTITDEDRSCILRDGRRLAYRVYGADDGVPVIALHGTPGSRLKYAMADGAARARGLRLICPDRWGYGLSRAPRHRSLAAYADDIAFLADDLGLTSFAVLGVSGGGPFAIAVGAQLRGRVSALALVAPVAPDAGKLSDASISRFHRFSFGILPNIPGVIRLSFWCFWALLRTSPRLAIKIAASRARTADRAVLADPDVWMDLAATFKSGLKSGVSGPVIDMSLFSGDWLVDLQNIAAPARLWVGLDDRNIPRVPALRLGNRIRGLKVIELEGAGHYWICLHYDEVLDWVRDQVFRGPDNLYGSKKHKAIAGTQRCAAASRC